MHDRSRSFVTVMSLYALVGGVVSILGWMLDVRAFSSWDGDIVIQPNAALAAGVGAVGLMLLVRGLRRPAFVLGIALALIGASALVQHTTNVFFPTLNTALMFGRNWGNNLVVAPGLMGLPSSVCWTAIGAALAGGAADRRARWIMPPIGIATFLIALLSVTGYLYGSDRLMALPRITAIALQTATFIIAVSLALIGAAAEYPPARWMLSRGTIGAVARRTLTLVVLLPLTLGWLRLIGEERGFYDARFGIAILAMAMVVALLAIVGWAIHTISRHEAALRASERDLSDTLETIGDGFVALDRDWRYRYVNATAGRIIGVDPSALRGLRIWDVVDEAEHPTVSANLRRAATEHVNVEFESYDAATQRWFTSSVFPVEDGGVTVYWRDITERKQTRLQLEADQRAMARLQALATRLVPAGDLHELLGEIVAATAELTGAAKASVLLWDPLTQQLSVGAHQGYGAAFAAQFLNGSLAPPIISPTEPGRAIVEDIEKDPTFAATPLARAMLADGIRAIQATLLRDRNGRVVGRLSSHFSQPCRPSERELRYVDLLARMAADVIERDQIEQRLREANRHKDAFIATLAHELRGPLAPMTNSLELLRRAGHDASIAEKARDILKRQLLQLTRLVDDLVDVSRISRDKLELRKQRVDFASIVDQAVESCAPLASALGHRVSVTLEPQPIQLDADAARLVQVFGNLLNNALKYTPPNGHVAVRAERDGNELSIRVKDDGVGIAREDLAGVFDIFAQAGRSTEQQHGGLGIGLYLVKRIVEMHGGCVEAHSDGVGRGSEFVVRLPMLGDVAARQPSTANGSASPPPSHSRRFLVVDDNRDSVSSLQALLELNGNQIRIAHDGLEALSVAEAFRPDVVLLDIGLPNLNGYDTCKRMREQDWGKTPVIVAVTGWGQPDDRRRSSAAGFDHHLVKPVEYSTLMNLLG